mgnify:CR=1 FL=1
MQYKLVASLRYVTGEGSELFFVKLIVAALILIAIIYWFFGTRQIRKIQNAEGDINAKRHNSPDDPLRYISRKGAHKSHRI